MIMPVTEYCPVQRKRVTMQVSYRDVSALSGEPSYVRELMRNPCPYIGPTGECSEKPCPVLAKAPMNWPPRSADE